MYSSIQKTCGIPISRCFLIAGDCAKKGKKAKESEPEREVMQSFPYQVPFWTVSSPSFFLVLRVNISL